MEWQWVIHPISIHFPYGFKRWKNNQPFVEVGFQTESKATELSFRWSWWMSCLWRIHSLIEKHVFVKIHIDSICGFPNGLQADCLTWSQRLINLFSWFPWVHFQLLPWSEGLGRPETSPKIAWQKHTGTWRCVLRPRKWVVKPSRFIKLESSWMFIKSPFPLPWKSSVFWWLSMSYLKYIYI